MAASVSQSDLFQRIPDAEWNPNPNPPMAAADGTGGDHLACRRAAELDCEACSPAESALWDQIDDAECCLVSGLFEQAASLVSSITKEIHAAALEKIIDDDVLAEMFKLAGMLFVQVLKELGRTSQMFDELKQMYSSMACIPVRVFLTGASMQITEGSGSELKAIFEEYLSRWRHADGQVYVLNGGEQESASINLITTSVMSAEQYLEVAEVYTITYLGIVSHEAEYAISWTEQAELAEHYRQDLLGRLRALQSAYRTPSTAPRTKQAAERNLSGSTTDSTLTLHKDNPKSVKPQYDMKPNDLKEISLKSAQPSVQRIINRIDPFFWWFRSFRIKVGKLQFVLPSGKRMLLFSLLLSTLYILRKKSTDLKRVASRQASSVRQALVDTWQLAFSVHMNPLAAVQQLPQAPR